ncbi:MAG TPA: S9 family peptidase [Minicystis sp.]|nr:S9 family peptidase [Minicystis sp.]
MPTAAAAAPAPRPAQPPAADSAPTVLSAAQAAKDAARVPVARALLDAYADGGALFTRSGAYVFGSTRGGLPELYVGDAARPREAPRRLPTPKERVAAATLTSDDRTVLFLRDAGGDRNFHVYAIGLDGTGLVDLTPGEVLHRNRPHVALGKPALFAYSAHATRDERTRVFVQRLGGPPREVFADARGGYLADFSSDGAHALFVRENSDQDSVVFDVDVASGKATRLFPTEGAPASSSGSYAPNGDRVFVTTHPEGRPPEVVSLDRRTGKALARYEETKLPNGDVDAWVSPSGDRIAVVVDGGTHTELRLLDARSLALVRTVDMPLGVSTSVSFSRDGKRLAFTHSTADAPPEIYVVDVAKGAPKRLRSDARPGLASIPRIETSIVDVPAFDGLKLPTNVYLPTSTSGKVPTIVLIHGGPSGSSAVRWDPDVRFFASLGYAVVAPNIRGSTGFGVAFQKADDKDERGDALRDVETINRWARAQPWCDGDRLVIMGTSYGGYMTLLALSRQPALWRAGVDLSGMSDLRTMEKLEDQAIRVYDETEFGVLGKEDDLLFEWSPLKYKDAIAAPVFVYQGTNDPVTPKNEADQIVKALRGRGVDVEYMVLSDEGHGIVKRDNRALFLARASRFLDEHAGPRPRPAP